MLLGALFFFLPVWANQPPVAQLPPSACEMHFLPLLNRSPLWTDERWERVWVSYLEHVSQNGAPLTFLREDLFPTLQALPREKKQWLLERAVAPRYPSARRQRLPEERRGEWLRPKKALDFIVQALVSARAEVEEGLERGQAFPEALESHWRNLRAWLAISGSPYGMNTVLSFAEEVQVWLRRFPGQPAALLMGSFPRGMADYERSDVDLNYPKTEFERWSRLRLRQRQPLALLTREALKKLPLAKGAWPVEYSGRPGPDWIDVPSSVEVKITPASIEFRVYPSSPEWQPVESALRYEYVREHWRRL